MDEAVLTVRFALGTIFLLSGVAKLANRREFERVVRDFHVTPASLSQVIAFCIPLLEIVLASFLLLGFAIRTAGAAVAALLLFFSMAIVINLARGRRISCGCFGTTSAREISIVGVARNLVLFACATSVSLRQVDVLSIDAGPDPSRDDLSAATGLGMVIAGTLAAFVFTIVQESISVLKAWRRLDRERGFSG